MKRIWWIVAESLRMGWACRQRARGFPWTIIPIPPRAWVHWRLDTAYGEGRWPSWRVIFRDACVFLLWRRRLRLERAAPRLR